MNDQKSEISVAGKTAQNGDKKEPYIISKEEYQSKIQPSWDKKTPLIIKGVKWMEEHTPETKYYS
ncbi:MAG: hypothetical protein ACTSQD_09015 [Promethearchaeota archaeon]